MLLRRLGVLAVVLTELPAPVSAASASPTSWGRPAAHVLTISGGVLASGTGARFGGTANLDAFTETRWVTMRADIAPYPF